MIPSVFRCVACGAKILRLQQNHSSRVPRSARVAAWLDRARRPNSDSKAAVPESASANLNGKVNLNQSIN